MSCICLLRENFANSAFCGDKFSVTSSLCCCKLCSKTLFPGCLPLLKIGCNDQGGPFQVCSLVEVCAVYCTGKPFVILECIQFPFNLNFTILTFLLMKCNLEESHEKMKSGKSQVLIFKLFPWCLLSFILGLSLMLLQFAHFFGKRGSKFAV